MLKLLGFMVLHLISSQFLEYRFLFNFGEVFYDFSSYSNHGTNGESHLNTVNNIISTDRGAYFTGLNSHVSIPPNTITPSSFYMKNPFSIQFWIKFDEISEGIIFQRVVDTRFSFTISYSSSTENIVISSTGISAIKGNSGSFPPCKSYLDFWVLISVNYDGTCFYILKNNQKEIISSQKYSDPTYNPIKSYIGSPNLPTMKGFISLFSISNYEDTSPFIILSTSSLCLTLYDSCESICYPTIKIGDFQGCISLESDPTKDSRSFQCELNSFCSAGSLLTCDSCAKYSCFLNPSNAKQFCISNFDTFTKIEITRTCMSTHLLDDSKCCYKECNGCNINYSEKCLSCVSSFASLASTGCNCVSGYGGTHPLVLNSCVLCKDECETCSSSSVCIKCKAQYGIPSDIGCKCKTGYYGYAPLNSIDSCKACKIECLTCGDYTSCSKCTANNSYSDSSQYGCTCSNGFHGNHPLVQENSCSSVQALNCGVTCSACNGLICLGCISDNAQVINNVCVCNTQYFANGPPLIKKDSCVKCKDECLECLDANSCKTCALKNSEFTNGACNCKDGFYKGLVNGKDYCMSCHKHCKRCENSYKCIECVASNASPDNIQGCTCNSNYFASNVEMDTEDACSICDSIICSVNLCPDLNIIYDNSENCICGNGYYKEELLNTNFQCNICHEECETCVKQDFCKKCKDINSKPDQTQGCICNEGYYKTSLINSKTFCNKCIINCIECSDDIQCSKCKTDFILSNDHKECILNCKVNMHGENNSCICDSGYYLLDNLNECVSCTYPCNTCLSLSKCLTCVEVLMEVNENNECTCKKGFYLSKKADEQYCLECKQPCNECLNLDFCLSCYDNGMSLYNGVCKMKCFNGVWNEINKNCICEYGMYVEKYDEESFICKKCEPECESCLNKTYCLSCLTNFTLSNEQDGICVKSCNPGFYLQNNLCLKCNTLCNDCKNSTFCYSCIDNSIKIKNICYCKNHTKFIKNRCQDMFFIFRLKQKNLNIFINFNETLPDYLEESNISVSIEGITKYSFSFMSSSLKTSIISLKPNENIPNNTKLTVEITEKTFYSSIDSKLLEHKQSILLNEYILTKSSNLIELAGKLAKPISQASTSTSVGLSIISNPASAWVLINTLQLIIYLPISSNNLSQNLRDFCASFGDFNLLPNLFLYMFSESSSSRPSKNEREVGIDTSVFFINAGKNFTLLISFVFLYPLIFILWKLQLGKLSQRLLKILKNYKYGIFIRYLIQSYLDLLIFSIIQIRSDINMPSGYFNLVISSVCMVIFI